MIQALRSQTYRLLDISDRFVLKRWSGTKISYSKNQQEGISDSQATPYQREIRSILTSPKKFNKFRRIFTYREIVESVTYKQGAEYINRINTLSSRSKVDFEVFKKNDSLGFPRLYKYPIIGEISPTTLRYISVALELQILFGKNLAGNFIEIGAGYGGQASILEEFFEISLYGIYDLEEAQDLMSMYLSRISKLDKIKMFSLDHSEEPIWNLAISNYAFSELPVELQKEYIEKVLSKSERGYLIMNSGRTNHSGRSDGKLNLTELRDLLPEFEILEEKPNTGPDNYVIVWGHKRDLG